jgi:hypothetical protein
MSFPLKIIEPARFCRYFLSEPVPDIHQGESQQVLSAPEPGIFCSFIPGGKADAPDAVDRTGLDQNTIASILQELSQLWMLAELMEVAANNDVITARFPCRFVEMPDFPAQGLGFAGGFCLENARVDFMVREHEGLLRHHPVFRGGIAPRLHDKGRAVPLTETGRGHVIRLLPMSPEEKEFVFPTPQKRLKPCLRRTRHGVIPRDSL